MVEQLDEHANQVRHCSLDDAGPFTLVAADAWAMKVCEGKTVVNTVVIRLSRTPF